MKQHPSLFTQLRRGLDFVSSSLSRPSFFGKVIIDSDDNDDKIRCCLNRLKSDIPPLGTDARNVCSCRTAYLDCGEVSCYSVQFTLPG